MKTSDLLKKAKTRIKRSLKGSTCLDDKFICYAFESQCFIYISTHEERSRKIRNFQEYIKQLLDGRPSLNSWLYRQGFTSDEQHSESYTNGTEEFQKMQTTRLAWIDWMINEYQEIGD